MLNQTKHLSRSGLIMLMTTVWLTLLSTAAAASENSTKIGEHPLGQLKISGISLDMAVDQIEAALTAQGYTEAGFMRFTKEEQLQNQRKTLYRIEIEDTPEYRSITYHRSLSGGRVKTTTGEQPVPDFEQEAAEQLYQIICGNVADQTKEDRSCEPLKPSSISANYGQSIAINNHFTARLSTTAANSIMGIKYTDQPSAD